MSSPLMSSAFAITAPATTVYLAEDRMGKMPFTVTNMTDHPLQGVAKVVPLDTAPPEWFKVVRGGQLNLQPKTSAQVLVQIDPPLGVTAATQEFRLEITDPSSSDAPVPGPSCEFVVPASVAKFTWTKPRGYLATLVGSAVGGLVGEIAILLSAKLPKWNCTSLKCVAGSFILDIFVLLLFVVAGIVLMWIGSALGAWSALRLRGYLGSKTTALFLGILMVPWTFLMLWLLEKITHNLALLLIIGPVVLTAVPGVLARGAVLLIRTKHI
jgi:hypothetical protein